MASRRRRLPMRSKTKRRKLARQKTKLGLPDLITPSQPSPSAAKISTLFRRFETVLYRLCLSIPTQTVVLECFRAICQREAVEPRFRDRRQAGAVFGILRSKFDQGRGFTLRLVG